MKSLFLGRPLHWILWLVLIGVLFGLGKYSFHVRYFVPFCLLLLALTGACIASIILSYREGERITREPFDDA